MMRKIQIISFLIVMSCGQKIFTQTPSCPYPIIMLHGWTGSNESWADFYQNADVENIYGLFDDDDQVFWAMPNATDTHDYYTDCCWWDPLCIFDCEYVVDSTKNDDINGPDGTFNNNPTDDDVQWVFPNENNQLISGCLYAYSFNVGKNTDGTIFKNSTLTSTAPCGDCSDNNEAAAYKQGYALKRVIEAVLAANPTKEKVVLIAHSMGGLCGREYLQRRDAIGNPQWWVDSTQADGHKVAKFITLGTPHRGSNTLGNLTFNDPHDRNDLPDLQSEGIRDIRYSYEDGSTGDDIPGTYLYGGLESGISDFLFSYWSKDVNCDGDDDDEITGINICGLNQGYSDTWDGTTDQPGMPLPDNIKYTYYVSDADGAVAEIRQWLYLGGNGSTSDYNADASVSVPHDGVDHRRSDRINVSRFHLNQTNDIDNVVRALDEADYAEMSYKINSDLWYFGLVQERAEKVPDHSEFTLTGDPLVDGDWYVLHIPDTVYQFMIQVVPQPTMTGRVDFYTTSPDSFSNNDLADTFLTWAVGADTLELISEQQNFTSGTYYIRISHDINSSVTPVSDVWKTPYYFNVKTIDPCEEILYITGLQDMANYNAGQILTSDAKVISLGDVYFSAGNYIELLPGFEVEHQAEFYAVPDTCSQ